MSLQGPEYLTVLTLWGHPAGPHHVPQVSRRTVTVKVIKIRNQNKNKNLTFHPNILNAHHKVCKLTHDSSDLKV